MADTLDVCADSLEFWLRRLESLDPTKIDLGLDRVRQVATRMNLASSSISAKIITIAGTNGKGTSVAVLETLLRQKGFACGSYSSPHLFHFGERIKISGQPVDDLTLVNGFKTVEQSRGDIPLTYFEFATLVAAQIFASNNLDFWILEVGLGGRLDAVNLFDADLAIVTNIGSDHESWLGDTPEKRAVEKAGIYRSGVPAIFAASDRPAAIDKIVADIEAMPVFLDEHYRIEHGVFDWEDKFSVRLPELENISADIVAGALAALGCLSIDVENDELRELRNLSIPGRFQRLNYRGAELIADVAHNAESAHLLAERLKETGKRDFVAVFGCLADKKPADIVEPLLSLVDRWIIVQPSTPRAAQIKTVERALADLGVENAKISNCSDIKMLSEYINQDDNILLYGSFYTVGECLTELRVKIV